MKTPSVFERSFEAFLFDMDGTVLDSIALAERIWGAWAEGRGLDVPAFLATIHGVRAVDNLALLAIPGMDVTVEAKLLLDAEMAEAEGVVPIPGAIEFLAALPRDRWAIVTSAPRSLALRRIEVAGLPLPEVLISGEDVSRGKPAPDCFILAAERLGFDVRQCLVFEDAPAGIQAAEAAAASVMVVTATHRHPVQTSHPTIGSYGELHATADLNGALKLSR